MSSPLPDLRLYNTLTRAKEVFAPIDASNVRMYVCGPTVYDLAHIGNARPLIVFDVLYRLLRHRYGADRVTYVRNITDVDDKINARAAERGISIRELTEETNRIFQADVTALGCLPPNAQPRATDYVVRPEAAMDMIRMIARLIDNGHAYVADGLVMFSVPSMADYGKLSRRPLDEMIAGARVDVAPYKRADTDFVLWKPSHASEPGWESPWGFGRPGWHIECSAMSAALLGETFDIHGGGIDLVFPHHENEIAQSRCCFGTPVMANVWMHNGFLQVEGEKMSKSLGNFVTIRELLRDYHGNVVRLAMLQTHYRQPLDWQRHEIELCERELANWSQSVILHAAADQISRDEIIGPDQDVVTHLCDDLNLPEALSRLRAIGKSAREKRSDARKLYTTLSWLGFRDLEKPNFFGRGLIGDEFIATPDGFFDAMLFRNLSANNLISEVRGLEAKLATGNVKLKIDNYGNVASEGAHGKHVQRLVDARLAARARKDWKESDRIRDELAVMGIALKDNKDGTTTWEVKR